MIMVTPHSGINMDILIIKHADLSIEFSTDYPVIKTTLYEDYNSAMRRAGSEYLSTAYDLSEEPLKFSIWDPVEDDLRSMVISAARHPVFFQGRSYGIVIVCPKAVSVLWIYAKNKQIKHSFKERPMENGSLLIGNITFQNDVGAFDLVINYTVGTISKTVIFKFEVFSVKLALKKHFPLMIGDIEATYPRLVLDYMKLTYHAANNAPGSYSDMLWWVFFENIYKSILKNFQFIFDKPYSALTKGKKFQKEDQIENPTAILKEKLKKYAGDPNKFFVVPGNLRLENNYENRVVKFILKDIVHKFQQIYKQVKEHDAGKRMTNEYKAQLEFAYRSMEWLREHPFFELIGDIGAVKETSNVLANRIGYAGLFKDWNKLKEGYRLFEGLYEIELKDIDYLYKMWCFMEIGALIRSLGGKKVKVIKIPEIMPDQFILSPDKDMNARIIFEFKNGDVVELYHELLYDNKDDSESGMEAVRPDIVLRIRKKDLPDKLYFTYLFDTSYRVTKSNDEQLPDLPVDTEMNGMRKYRDIIYFKEKNRYTKEVMGIYLLYPGEGTPEQIRNMRKKMIPDACGIPFCPGEKTINSLLEDWLSNIINTEAAKLLRDTYPQKGKEYKKDEVFVFIPFIKKEDAIQLNYLENTEVPLFDYKSFLPALGEGTLRYFAHYSEGKGIKYVYEIESFYWKAGKDVYPPDHELFRDDVRKCLVLKLVNKRVLDEYLQIRGVISNMRYTKMEYLNHPINGFVKTISERETLLRNS
jgi:hypothetical protein